MNISCVHEITPFLSLSLHQWRDSFDPPALTYRPTLMHPVSPSLSLLNRLLDICHGNRSIQERQFTLYLVFEHVEQDLATYLELCPSPGLSPDRIKVTYSSVCLSLSLSLLSSPPHFLSRQCDCSFTIITPYHTNNHWGKWSFKNDHYN